MTQRSRNAKTTTQRCEPLFALRGSRQPRAGGVYDEWSGLNGATAEEYIEREPESTWTGLYDHTGTPLHRPREPVGYNPNRWNCEMKKPGKKKKGRGCR